MFLIKYAIRSLLCNQSRDNSVGTVDRLQTVGLRNQWFDSWKGQGVCLFSAASILAIGPLQYPTKFALGGNF
jgi:hypothetical protein